MVTKDMKKLEISQFLDLIGSKLKENRPDVPSTHNYSVKYYGDIIHFWFRTQGCRYTRNGYGGCLMCDYSTSSKAPSQELIGYIKEGLNEIENMGSMLLINSSGSFFDNYEVSQDVRLFLYTQLKKYGDLRIIFESLLEVITESDIIELRKILNTQTIDIEFGLESSNPIILKYAINKRNTSKNNIINKIALMNRYDINAVANVLVGSPFLSEKENIQDAVQSITDAFKLGVSYVVLFPVNIKPYTVVNWLYENKYYDLISLWSYIEVLNQVDKRYLNHIELSWYKSKIPNNPLYQKSLIAPTTCSHCQAEVLGLLDEFSSCSNNRKAILTKINKISCSCKITWRERLNNISDYKNMVLSSYQKMAIEILGENFWQQHGQKISKELKDDCKIPV